MLFLLTLIHVLFLFSTVLSLFQKTVFIMFHCRFLFGYTYSPLFSWSKNLVYYAGLDKCLYFSVGSSENLGPYIQTLFLNGFSLRSFFQFVSLGKCHLCNICSECTCDENQTYLKRYFLNFFFRYIS